MNNSPYFWLEQLVDREPDVETLLLAYRAMQQASAPSCSVIIAESGVGKTRLAREMYIRLAREDDKNGYWPQKFGGDLLTMDVVPDFTNHTTSEVAQMPPFLWWSIRFNKPDARNRTGSSGTAVTDSIGQLLLHLAVVTQATARTEAFKEYAETALDALMEVGADLLPPGVGIAKTLLIKAKERWKQRKEQKKLLALKESSVPGTEVAVFEAIVPIAESLSKLIYRGPAKLTQAVPFILFLDDLQFASDNEITQVCHILDRAILESWPLQVIATTWPAEWDAATSVPNSPMGRFQTVIEKFRDGSIKLAEIRLSKVQDSFSLISTALPGLTEQQRKDIQKKFSGDIYTLSMCIRNLRNRPTNFVNKDTSRELNSAGLKQAFIYPPDRENAIQERFNELSEENQQRVAICALLGHRSLLNLSCDIAHELLAEVQDNVGSEASDAPVGSADSESDWLLREVSAGIGEFVDEISRSVASAQIANIEDDVKAFASAALRTMQKWIDEGTAERLTAYETRYFIAGARSVLSLVADQNYEIENVNLDRFSNCIQLINEIENGFILDSFELPAAVFASTFLSETQALASLSFTWRARWLHSASMRGPWLDKGGRPLALLLRSEGFKLLHYLANRIQNGEQDLQLVEAIGLAANTSVGLTWSIMNSETLSERPDLSWEVDDALMTWASENKATFKRMEAESLEEISKAIATIGAENSETVLAAKAVLWYSMKRMIENISESQYDLHTPIANAICLTKLSGENGNRLIEILFERGVLSEVFFGWRYGSPEQEIRQSVVAHIVHELAHIRIQTAGNYQLLALSVGLDVDVSTDLLRIEDNFDIAWNCSLELINRGWGELVIDWASNYPRSIRWAIGLHAHQLARTVKGEHKLAIDLSRGWSRSAKMLSDIKAVSERSNEMVLIKLLIDVFYEMASAIFRTNESCDLDGFIQEAKIAANGAFRDVENCARIAWSDATKAPTAGATSPKGRIYPYETSYRALAGVPNRVFRILGRHYALEKEFENLENALAKCDREDQLFEITSAIALERLTEGFTSNLEDWRNTTINSLVRAQMSASEKQKTYPMQGERLFTLWNQALRSVSDRSDLWKSDFDEINSLVLTLTKK